MYGVVVIPNDKGDGTPSAVVLSGTQHVKKFNRARADEVRVLLGLFRVEHKNIDLVVSCNVPVKSGDGGAVGEEGFNGAKSDFDNFVKSLRIVDFGLFA